MSTHERAPAIDSLVKVVAFRDPANAAVALASIWSSGIPGDLLERLQTQLQRELPLSGNPDLAVHYLSRFVGISRNPQALASLFERDPQSLHGLLRIFGFSPWLAECLLTDPEAFDLIRMTEGQPIDRAVLVDEIHSECALAATVPQAAAILRRHRRRETLRIAYGDLVHDQPLQRTCEQLSFLADAILSAALAAARTLLVRRRNERSGGEPPDVSMTILATGQYGGREQDYGDALEVLLLFEQPSLRPGEAAHQHGVTSGEFAQQWGELLLSLLSAADPLGPVYELHQRLRPASAVHVASDVEDVLRYFNLAGRTWHRHGFTRARVAAGDHQLGDAFIARLEPWVYRRYLGTADLEGIKSLKRKLARRSRSSELAPWHFSSLRDTTQDIEHVTQFLQLLNGADLPPLRVASTLQAIGSLEHSGCLTMQERTLLSEHYIALRRLQHRFQLATHTPRTEHHNNDPAATVAAALGYHGTEGASDTDALRDDCLQRRGVCRLIIDHLVHDVFADSGEIPFETEMVLDPEVETAAVTRTLKGYGFRHPAAAFDQLLALAREPIRFLSDRRTRHFLAGIAPKLLEEIAATPEPDKTLERLAAISDSLGGKAALWELFQTTPSALRLCTRLCASSPYLTGILTSNPGMLDELIDSLVLDRLPQADELEQSSVELCRFAEDIDPILHSFKNSAHLRIGVRDILGRDCLEDTHRAIADTAEVCLRRMAEDEMEAMCNRYGDPLSPRGQRSELTVVALGRLGGREPNYHSDLDVLFLYDHEGQTRPRAGGRRDRTTNDHFFNELAQRISKRVNHYGPAGRLYELDAGIRFSSHRGTMAVTIDQFRQHFQQAPDAALWQRLALIPARVILGSPESRQSAEDVIRGVLLSGEWTPSIAAEAQQLRYSLQRGAAAENLKRGPGGTMDVETIVQVLLLRHARQLDAAVGLGTLEGLELLRTRQWISDERAEPLAASYRYLRSVESNLRLMNLPARHDLPESADELRCLAFAMRETQPDAVIEKCDAYRESNRRVFEDIFAEETSAAMEI